MALTIYEKRRHDRIDAIIKVDIFEYRGGKFLGKGYITDISISGLRVETNDEINDSEDLFIKFLLPNGYYFDGIRSRILRTQKDSFSFIYGIRFVELFFKDKFRIWMFTKNIMGCRDL